MCRGFALVDVDSKHAASCHKRFWFSITPARHWSRCRGATANATNCFPGAMGVALVGDEPASTEIYLLYPVIVSNATRCFFFCLSLKLRRSLLLLCRRFHHTGAELWEHSLPVNHTVGKTLQFLEKGKVTWLWYAFVRFDSKSVYRWCWVRVCCLDSVDPLDLRVAARLPTRLPLSEPPSMLLPPAAGVGQKWCCTLIRSGHQTGRQFYLVWLRWRFQDISRVFIFAHLQGEGL